ncbi:Trm112 family protein [Oceanimonas baumannii]|uniref:Trm112 family protein n=1 Tax=Oceanimonas baumannii TaxID=129578 RepID=UPI003C7CEA65
MDAKLVEIIACPVCKGKLQLDREHNELVCRFDRLAYPITENIPVLLETRARRLDPDELPG